MGKNKIFCSVDAMQYPEVEEWLNAVTDKKSTRQGYARYMSLFLEFSKLTPNLMLEIKRQGVKEGNVKTELESKMVNFLRQLEDKYAPGTVVVARMALSSFLAFHGFQVPKKFIRLPIASVKVIRVPEQNEVEAMINYAGSLVAKSLLTVAAEVPCRPRVFMAVQWSWLEPGWEEKDIAHIQIPPSFRPKEPGPKKFEPMAYVGKRGIVALKQIKAKRGEASGRIFPYTPEWFQITPTRIYWRAVAAKAIRASREDEQLITLKSFRKYVFNVIDEIRGEISPEWRNMLKGRDLGVEKYYSKAYIEKLREVYRSKIYPLIWKQEVTVDEKKLQLDMARKVLAMAGIDADQVLRSMPHIVDIGEQLKLLDEQIKTLGLRHRPDGGMAITAADKEALIGFARFLKRFAALP